MQVHHVTEDGSRSAIVSFFIDHNDDESNYINDFFTQLNPQSWSTESETFLQQVSLNFAYKGGLKQSYRKSYFYYRGSESIPPCVEGVDRFILEEPLTASKTLIKYLSNNSVNRLKV